MRISPHLAKAFLVLAALAGGPRICLASIDVSTTFGAVPDGVTDNSAAIAAAFQFAAQHPGTQLYFPCARGNTYLVTRPIQFPAFSVIEGDGKTSCRILYSPVSDPGMVVAAFSFVGTRYTRITDIALETSAAYPPQTITQMGGGQGLAGALVIENVTIKGFASVAASYAIGSENDSWNGVLFVYEGGGAKYVFYTTRSDDFGICSECTSSSNLSLYFDSNVIEIDSKDPIVAIGSRTSGGTGDQYFTNLHIALNKSAASAGFQFTSGAEQQGGPNSIIRVSSTRIEGGGIGISLKKDSQPGIFNLHIEDVTWSPARVSTPIFINGDDGLTIYGLRLRHNLCTQSDGVDGASSIYSLADSEVSVESGSLAIRYSATGNTMVLRGTAAATLPAIASDNSIWARGQWVTGAPNIILRLPSGKPIRPAPPRGIRHFGAVR